MKLINCLLTGHITVAWITDQNIKKIKFYYLKMLPLLSLQDSMMADPNLCLSIMQK